MKNKNKDSIDNIEKIIEEYELKQKRDKKEKIVLIIIIIFLLLLLLAIFKLGKIGYDPNENICINQSSEEKQNQDDDDDEKDKTNQIIIKDNKGPIKMNSILDIFNNFKFENQKIIAPGSYGEYHFSIINDTNSKIVYSIKFDDIMTNKVNMKYRLKLDNSYLKGDNISYVSIEQLNISNIIALEKSNNLYTLEWYWEDDDPNDNYVGSQIEEQKYTLNVEINAEEKN